MIDLQAAKDLIDLGSSQGSELRGREQLHGAVALYNMIEKNRVAYLADEVGMGKTYVALAVVALLRHFQPGARVLIVAPKENIQEKWEKELRNFIELNVRFPDLRVKGVDGRSIRPPARCHRLIDFVREVNLDADRDFILRLTSFRLPLQGGERVDEQAGRAMRDELREVLPWLKDEVFDLRRSTFKDNIARAICCALPPFDLVIVDEAHNLKHGFTPHGSSQNRVLALTMGHPEPRSLDDSAALPASLFPGYGLRARRLLLLSATPIDEDYRHLWNQLDVFGLGAGWEELKEREVDDRRKKDLAKALLIRRVTAMEIAGERHTKNLYRREWRGGGVSLHDEPIEIRGDRERLVVALVQKKVSELLGDRKLGNRFQIGMLASFESFLETAKVKRTEDERGTFDDGEQTEDSAEREGLDVRDINDLAKRYRQLFNAEMPHPKMDALVDQIRHAWRTGEKALVFVRRVASVKELRRKLEDTYDAWLFERLRAHMPDAARDQFERVVQRFAREKQAARADGIDDGLTISSKTADVDDRATGTFFAWFFRGRGSVGVWSGRNLQRAVAAGQGTYFDDHDIGWLLRCRQSEVAERLAAAVSVSGRAWTVAEMSQELRRRSAAFLSRAPKHPRGKRFEAVQAAAIEWLSEIDGPYRELARVMWHERYVDSRVRPAATNPPDLEAWLNVATFFSRLRERPTLEARLLPSTRSEDARAMYRERTLRCALLSAAVRLGHAAIDLYQTQLRRRGTLELGASEDDDGDDVEGARIDDFLDLLEEQQRTEGARDWGAFDELAALADNFDLILSVNEPTARDARLAEITKSFGTLLGSQVPVGGMAGGVNRTLVRQFRMPGYPFCLVTTDVLQEGEDLHTFCSAIYHYGISWTPSAMEQRIGRIDRVRSHTARRLDGTPTKPEPQKKLQVYYPYLADTVEVLQVRRVFERMNTFLRLMHEELGGTGLDSSQIDVGREALRGSAPLPAITTELKSSFDVQPELLRGEIKALEVDASHYLTVLERFERALAAVADVKWEESTRRGVRLGTMAVGARKQPVGLFVRSFGRLPMVRCISPIGLITSDHEIDPQHVLFARARAERVRIGAIAGDEQNTYNFTVEGDVLLVDPSCDTSRISGLVANVARRADEFELALLEADEPLSSFATELATEDPHGR
ncbi:MAG: DEAD/DEAH box helicase family protein [Deltaproteobacteria bacterium]|nr:DEAD/DEAH box helicase family protein [Deltaproteobacteria bacterium]